MRSTDVFYGRLHKAPRAEQRVRPLPRAETQSPPPFSAQAIDAIKREDLERFVARLVRDKKLSAKRAKNVLSTFRRILASAVEWDVMIALPRFPRIRVAESGYDFFTRDESDKLLGAARTTEERAILMFALHTGARAGEQLAFEWSDLDLYNKLAVFRRSSSLGIVGPTKSGKERKVPLTPTLEATLRAIRHARGRLVFCNPDGKPLTLWQLHERLEGACRRAGLRRIRWHDCRHSFASQLASAGVPLRQVQEYLGHSTILMTMRYAHLAPNDGADMRRALDRAAGNQGNSMAAAASEAARTAAS